MLDVKFIRENKEKVKEALRKRNCDFNLDKFLELEGKRRGLIKRIDNLRQKRNQINEEIKRAIKEKKDPQKIIEEGKEIAKDLDNLEEEFKKVKKEFNWLLLNIPNIPHPSIPEGD
ncbi:MAG TPA: serine--tRNA ligase, partial [Candidatus Omnitrophica bacterium]|nr:serine--tRNA ligase [Candidatus Omnitrophota bacterium]